MGAFTPHHGHRHARSEQLKLHLVFLPDEGLLKDDPMREDGPLEKGRTEGLLIGGMGMLLTLGYSWFPVKMIGLAAMVYMLVYTILHSDGQSIEDSSPKSD